MNHRQKMVEYFGLQRFIFYPHGIGRKEIEFDRQSMRSGLQLTDKHYHLLIHFGMMAQVIIHVLTEDIQVHFFLTRFFETFHPRLLLEMRQLLFRTETNRVHIDVDGTLHASSANVEHSSPVLERIIYQCIRRNGSNGLVPIAYLHCGQSYFYHIPIGTIFRHGNPIARSKHVIHGKLDTGHQSLDGILKNQHQDSCPSSQSRQNSRRTLIQQGTYNHNHSDAYHHQFQHLIKSFQRTVFQLFMFTTDGIKRSDEGTNQPHDNNRNVNVADFQYKLQQIRFRRYSQWNQSIKHHGRDQMTHIVQHLFIQDIVVPSHLCLGGYFLNGRYNDLPANFIKDKHNQQYRQYHDYTHHPLCRFTDHTHLL